MSLPEVSVWKVCTKGESRQFQDGLAIKTPGRLFNWGSDALTRSEGLRLQIAKQNQIRSPLLRLPPELRSKIYEYISATETYEVISTGTFDSGRRASVVPSNPHLRSISKACRQLYIEYSASPYTFRNPDMHHLYPDIFKHKPWPAIQSMRLEFPENRAWRPPETYTFVGFGIGELVALRLLPNMKRLVFVVLLHRNRDVYDSAADPFSETAKTPEMEAWEQQARMRVCSERPDVHVGFEYQRIGAYDADVFHSTCGTSTVHKLPFLHQILQYISCFYTRSK